MKQITFPKITFFDTHSFDKEYFLNTKISKKFEIDFIDARLNPQTAKLCKDAVAVCAFVNDDLSAKTLKVLNRLGVKIIALRSAGFNQVDLVAAKKLNIKVVRVPEYSPYAVAEHTVALLLSLVRKTHKAYNRVREQNFSLDHLVGFDLHQKKVGVIGTGKIGSVFCHILNGFGCEILAFDQARNKKLEKLSNFKYVDKLSDIYRNSDIISLHLPLNKSTFHLINSSSFRQMKKGVVILNTSRGKLIDTKALIKALKTKKVSGAGLDVYEEEENYFFMNYSNEIISDDQLARLMSFPNVLITAHQAFLTKEALNNIAEITLNNILDIVNGKKLKNEVFINS